MRQAAVIQPQRQALPFQLDRNLQVVGMTRQPMLVGDAEAPRPAPVLPVRALGEMATERGDGLAGKLGALQGR